MNKVRSKESAPNVRDALRALSEFKAVMTTIAWEDLEDDTSLILDDALQVFEYQDWSEVIARGLDELDLVSEGRVDTDVLTNIGRCEKDMIEAWLHGHLDRCPAEGISGRGKELLDRYMRDHPDVKFEINTERNFKSGAYARYLGLGVTGTKAARRRFHRDPRWPRLLEALEHVHQSDHQLDPDDKRDIPDVLAHVFS